MLLLMGQAAQAERQLAGLLEHLFRQRQAARVETVKLVVARGLAAVAVVARGLMARARREALHQPRPRAAMAGAAITAPAVQAALVLHLDRARRAQQMSKVAAAAAVAPIQPVLLAGQARHRAVVVAAAIAAAYWAAMAHAARYAIPTR